MKDETPITEGGAARLRAVLFDRDDTLSVTNYDSYRDAARYLHDKHGVDQQRSLRAFQEQWEAVGRDWRSLRTVEEEAAFWDRYAGELGNRLGLDKADSVAFLQEWPFWRHLTPVEHAREVLTELRSLGLRIGVLSNTMPNVEPTLEAIGLADLVDVALSSCALGVHKPERGVFELAAQRLEVRPDEVLFVDDLPENVAGAREAGMQALLIDHRGQLEEAVHHLREVLEAVRS